MLKFHRASLGNYARSLFYTNYARVVRLSNFLLLYHGSLNEFMTPNRELSHALII